ncbi:MAG TPA: RNA 3'-terminal phosphate cyclase [Anaerolineae bacterium]
MLVVDGSQGEGGGQILRTCLSLSALTGRPFRLENIRAGRSRPGLRPQHLTAVRAMAAVCNAEVTGDKLNSSALEFRPQSPPQNGEYNLDVSDAAEGGSAGAVTLIFQALLWPLLFAPGSSYLVLRGGTHVPFSPPYHYLAEVARPAFVSLGANFTTELKAWGWYPAGGGEMAAVIEPIAHLQAAAFARTPVARVEGVAAVTNLPAHIPHRMARRADNLLAQAGYDHRIEALRERGKGPGAGIVLWLPHAGFTSLGRPGLPAEKVAETAVAELLAFLDNGAIVDKHLADQLLLPLALAQGSATYTTDQLTQHVTTSANLLSQWLDVTITITGEANRPAQIEITGAHFTIP